MFSAYDAHGQGQKIMKSVPSHNNIILQQASNNHHRYGKDVMQVQRVSMSKTARMRDERNISERT